jgi:hypothetical protein
VSSLVYLLIAVLLSVIGTLILWYRHRRPRSMEEGIEEFSRELRALAPERRTDRGEGRAG